MNENTQYSISLTASLSLFVLALTLGLFSLNIEDKAMKAVSHWIGHEDHRVQAVTEPKDEETYTGAQVLQTLRQINQLNADVQIDSKIYSKTMDIENTDVSGIDTHKTYIVTYQRDRNGALTKLIFKGGE